MAFTPTRISELTLQTPQPTDQVPIARGSGTSGRTYRVYIRDLIGGVFNAVDTPTINLTFDSSTVTLSAEVIDNSINNLKLRDGASLSVIGRSANSFGNPADIAATTNGQVLRVNNAGTVLGFGPVDLANPNSVTNVLPISAGGTGASDRKNLVPIGAIMPMATPTAPIGWLYCDGSTIPGGSGGLFQGNKPVADLQELRNLLAYTYDPTGTTSFGKLPDLRGMFVRGWDDGRGKDSGRAFASDQLDAFQGHKHGIYDPQHGHIGSTNSTGDHAHTYTVYIPAGDTSEGLVSSPTAANTESGANSSSDTTNTTGAHSHIVTIALTSTGVLVQNPTADSANAGSVVGNSNGTAPRTADETRPENVALYYCIKY
jgi:hypothetical protein